MYILTHIKWTGSFLMLLGILMVTIPISAQAPYITVWQTDNHGNSDDDQIILHAWGHYDYTWEEIGNPGNVGSGSESGETTLTFPHPGQYELKLTPTGTDLFHRIKIGGEDKKLLQLTQWGDVVWSSFKNAYRGADYLSITATDLPDLSQVSSMKHAFSATGFQTVPNINNWDVSHVTTMSHMFFLSYFNQAIDNWDVSQVTDMSYMFGGAFYFNQPLENWNVSQVTTMEGMFDYASAFNQPLGNWNVSHVTSMRGMFKNNYTFNQPLQKWDVSGVTDMREMFALYPAMLPISSPTVSFSEAHTGNDEDFGPYNQPLNDWDVSRVKKMDSMFINAEKFDRPLDQWKLDSLQSAVDMFSESKISCENYSLTLRGWAMSTHTPTDIDLGASTLEYSPDITGERDHLITDLGWTISGDQEGTCTLGLAKHPQQTFQIYPNPTHRHLSISGLTHPGRFVLYNLSGRKIEEGELSIPTTTLNLHHVAKGIYVLHFHFKNGQQATRKIVKD